MNDEKVNYISICYPSKESASVIKPSEFLSWAKSDLKGSDKRSRGNALSNIKKAIHSRIDEIIHSTHVSFAKDWDKNIGTDEKIKILKKLGLEKTTIVQIITNIRNTYEHKYILPELRTIRAYLETTELWLNNSYQEIVNGRIGIANFPVLSVDTDNDRNIIKLVVTDYTDIHYFWDRKKTLIKTTKDRVNDVKELKDLSWQDILDVEKKYLKMINKSRVFYYLSQKNMTKLYNFYNKQYRGFSFFGIMSSIKFD